MSQAIQNFKGAKLTKRKLVNSIKRFYAQATAAELIEGLAWYNEANLYCKELASRFNISVSQAAGLIAVFSPQAGWLENKRYALNYLINPSVQLRSQVQQDKAKLILTLKSETDIYNAQSTRGAAFKTKSFFLNISNPDIVTSVTIDRHAIAVCIQDINNVHALDQSYGQLTAKQYAFFESAYLQAANELEILPHQLQAIVWVTYRRLRALKQDQNTNQWVPFTESEF